LSISKPGLLQSELHHKDCYPEGWVVVEETIRCIKKDCYPAMDAKMSQNTKLELMGKLRFRYVTAGRVYRRKIIDQAVELMGYHRKSAIRALGGKTAEQSQAKGVIGRPRLYYSKLLLPTLKRIWKIGQQPCGRRLEAMMPEWVPAYEAFYGSLSCEVREQLIEASSATLDRLLRPVRIQSRSPRGTRPGTMLRQEIPIRGGAWQSDEAGWTEADTVSLCGGSACGEVVWMVNNVDICTTWVEMRAMFGRGQHAAVEQLKDIENHLPFPWLGLDTDNGGEFINRHLLQWCQTGRQVPIFYTRSRPYRSNDNAHVEQKNWTHVRQWFGYERHDNSEVTGLMNDLARGDLGHFLNLFSPSMKLESQKTIEGKTKRIYGKPVTPYARVLVSPQVSSEKKAQLQRLKESLNPFALELSIQKKLREINRIRRALE
jgi:hypothetical protein